MHNILDYNIVELKNLMKEKGESEFRAKQIFDWIYKGTWNFNEMLNLPKALKEKLCSKFYIGIPQVMDVLVSKDKETMKFLMEYNDGNIIECVVMKYNYGNSICVSTQVGCRMGCKFCASTIEGMVRNLTCGEILGQVLKAQGEIKERISNIVLMGSGEPLDNYDNVIKFIELINSDYGLNIGQRHITLSTCGIVPKIMELADKELQITLAVSLHAPNDELRRKMMPIANKFSIDDILNACGYFIDKTKRRITFEYALVKGVNDSKELALELSEKIKGMLCHVNLIPVNEISENNLVKSSSHNVSLFYRILIEEGVEVTIRREMGTEINAACGQLRRRYLASKDS